VTSKITRNDTREKKIDKSTTQNRTHRKE